MSNNARPPAMDPVNDAASDLRCLQRRHPGVGPEDEAEHAIRCPGVGQGPLDDSRRSLPRVLDGPDGP